MGLLSGPVGQKNLDHRTIIAAIYAILIVGGITMVYPFLIMIAGSFKSDVDIHDMDVIPKYFYNDQALYRRYLEGMYNGSVTVYNTHARQDEFSFKRVEAPAQISGKKVEDWREFRSAVRLPACWTVLGSSYFSYNKLSPKMDRLFRRDLAQKYGTIEEFNSHFGSMAPSWLGVHFPSMNPIDRAFKMGSTTLQDAAIEFAARQAPEDSYALSLDGDFTRQFLQLTYGREIKGYNAVHGTRYQGYQDIHLSAGLPDGANQQKDWLDYVRNQLNLQFVTVDAGAVGEFRAFLKRRYGGDLAQLNRAYGSHLAGFEQFAYPEDRLRSSPQLVDWELFIREVPGKYLGVTGPEFSWRKFLKSKYGGDLARLSQAHGAAYDSFETVPMPLKDVDYQFVKEHRGELRWEFASRNYAYVMEYFLFHGRGLFNTFVFCAFMVVSALVINPIAAYGMSRFNLPSTYKILLFLLATMAFPPMVTTIPNFLLLKDLHLLNTFYALVLPGVVNGYSIFILKGFFDSLPRELYESAQIDGAGEWTMMWHFTFKLSKPILAVISLGAFNAAYGAFVFAFVVCQDEKMWTLMVWLYQLQQTAHQSVAFAALLIAAVPTFIAFMLAQKFILQGIPIPSEK